MRCQGALLMSHYDIEFYPKDLLDYEYFSHVFPIQMSNTKETLKNDTLNTSPTMDSLHSTKEKLEEKKYIYCRNCSGKTFYKVR